VLRDAARRCHKRLVFSEKIIKIIGAVLYGETAEWAAWFFDLLKKQTDYPEIGRC